MMFFINYFLKDTLYKLFYMHFSLSDYKLIYRYKVQDNQEIKLTKEKPKLISKSILLTHPIPVDRFLNRSTDGYLNSID
jgi:hypothetical protein